MFFSGRSQAASRIAVFLGNPGARFEDTRHNAGFMAAAVIEKTEGVRINRVKFRSLTALAALWGQRVLLMKPQTYMNLSGDAVRQAMDYYKIDLENLIVVSDDVSLPAGKLRVRRSGSAGGHNGLRDIIKKCGGEGFPRVKIGVGAPPHKDYDMADWVLAKLTLDDRKLISEAAVRAAGAVSAIVSRGADYAIPIYNAPPAQDMQK